MFGKKNQRLADKVRLLQFQKDGAEASRKAAKAELLSLEYRLQEERGQLIEERNRCLLAAGEEHGRDLVAIRQGWEAQMQDLKDQHSVTLTDVKAKNEQATSEREDEYLGSLREMRDLNRQDQEKRETLFEKQYQQAMNDTAEAQRKMHAAIAGCVNWRKQCMELHHRLVTERHRAAWEYDEKDDTFSIPQLGLLGTQSRSGRWDVLDTDSCETLCKTAQYEVVEMIIKTRQIDRLRDALAHVDVVLYNKNER